MATRDKSKVMDPGRNTTNAEKSATVRAAGKYAVTREAKKIASGPQTTPARTPTERGYYRKQYTAMAQNNRDANRQRGDQARYTPGQTSVPAKQSPYNRNWTKEYRTSQRGRGPTGD